MLGRVAELNYLNELYESEKFEFLVMYGRRRVGKTTLLQEFSKHTNAIFFPAREKNDALNLEDFSKTIQLYFDQQFISSFKSWEDAFVYIGNKIQDRTALIIDEFHISLKKTLLLNHFYNMPLIIAGRIKISF